MHPLRITLYVSLAIALAVSAAFGYALNRLAVPMAEVVILAAAVFILFLVPWTAVFVWAVRYATSLDELTDRTRSVVEGDSTAAIADREYHAEVDDLARVVEELRQQLVRQHGHFEESQRATQQIIDALGEGLMAIDARGRVVVANAWVRRTFGTDEVHGRPFLEIVRNRTLADAFERALRGEPSTVRTPLGERAHRQIEMRASPVTSSEIAAMVLFIDVTDIERLQRIRKDFLDDFSHEVRTPLAGLHSALESFERDDLTPEQEEQLRGVMMRQLRRIERLVQDLSELNQIESGGLVLHSHNVEILALARELVDEFRRRPEAQSLVFTVKGQPTYAYVDASRVQQIVTNLLDNACKHGGTAGEVVVEVAADGGEAVLRVSDEGEGIPPADVERIFNRFYRVDRSRSQQVPGVGLGLAIAKHLSVVLQGSIRAFNREPRGATFEVRLPLAHPSEQRRAG